MKFSIIGTGFIFPSHVEAIRYVGGKIRDVVNTARGEDKWREMIKNTDAECIVILTPNDLHFPMVMAAAEAKKIVLCEKPLTIKSKDAETLATKPNIFTILQLHHHPLVKELKEKITTNHNYEIKMDISVYRDENYFKSWKGMKERSGGVLFNLGIHYFELLSFLFGKPKELSLSTLDEKTGTGIIKGENYRCDFRISVGEKRENQRRVFKINGIDYNLSSKDNLSYENLHHYVYEDLLKGIGITPGEAVESIKIIERLIDSKPI